MWEQRIKHVVAVILCAGAFSAAQAAPQVVHVDAAAIGAGDGSSWADAFVSLQDGLTAAGDVVESVEIRVAQGTYKPFENAWSSDATFLVLSGMVLKGGYAGVAGTDPDARDIGLYPSVLDGLGSSSTAGRSHPVSAVVTADYTDDTTLIDGFTIRGGRVGVAIEAGSPVVSHCTFEGSDVECRAAGSPAILDCHFDAACLDVSDCQVSVARCLFERASLHAVRGDIEGTLIATDCIFRENPHGAIFGYGWLHLDLLRCSFLDNSDRTHGGPTIFTAGNVVARRCSFRSNRGPGEVLSASGSDLVSLTDCEFSDNSASGGLLYISGDVATVSRCSFVGNTAARGSCDVLRCWATFARVSQCLFSGNTCPSSSVISGRGLDLQISNCTFAANRSQLRTIAGTQEHLTLTQCICRDGCDLFGGLLGSDETRRVVTFSNIEGGCEGLGNIDVDPGFVQEGYWADPNNLDTEVGPDVPEAVWVAGDYHLQSQAGHWDPETETWVLDEMTSPCIDAGDPNGYLGDERFPNGGYVNLGAYGGTLEASRSYFGKPVCENQLAGDINGDCIVDQTDMDILLSHWLMRTDEPVNLPPAITLIAPQDGAEFAWPEPIVFRVEASDPDGSVERVDYFLRKPDNEWYSYGIGPVYEGQENGWEVELDWANLAHSTFEVGTYKVWARATDDKDARTNSPEITIAVHPQN